MGAVVDIRKIYNIKGQYDSGIYLSVAAKKAATLFGSTDSISYPLPSSKYFKKCVPKKSQARIFLFATDVLACFGSREMPGCRSPPLISILPANSKIEIGGYHEENQSAGLLPVLYKRYCC